ncbi:MAG: HEPN domain-containing protein [Candidatus Diapherotrites archaeon]|nr:HEPN domain-containing protein [Candidatus Diapherotrites archaeon]
MSEILFWGVLKNVDESILGLKLDKGFVIKSCGYEEFLEIISRSQTSLGYYAHPYPDALFSQDDKIIYIENKFKSVNQYQLAPFQKEYIGNYLKPTLALLRLFKEGNIQSPLSYYFSIGKEQKTIKPFGSEKSNLYYSTGGCYKLKKEEINELEKFLNETKFPFLDHLQLAFENLDMSYTTQSNALAYLSIMTGVEAIFNDGQGEIGYKISRNMAMLLGNNKEDAQNIFKQMKRLYNLRCKLVHQGHYKNVDIKDVIMLREYLRSAIKKLVILNKPKDALLEDLTFSGFEYLDVNK